MKKNCFFLLVLGCASLALMSCEKSTQKEPPEEQKINLDTTVGQLVHLAPIYSIPVRGYGIVAGLWGTGSSECPTELRKQIEKEIWQRLPQAKTSEVNRIIESTDTAVVEITGIIPPLVTSGEHFDIQVKPLAKTQTTSLRGGILYATELREMSRLGGYEQYTKTLGYAEGPVFYFTDPNTQEPCYTVLGGGVSILDPPITLVLNTANYNAANAIRNRINERFGPNTAKALSSVEIQIKIPIRYHKERMRFLSMIQLLYLSEDDTLRTQRLDTLITDLADPQKAVIAEIALEAIGKPAIAKLKEVLNNPTPSVRLSAARCMLNMGDNYGIDTLRNIISDTNSNLRIPAIQCFAHAKLKDAESILSPLLQNPDFNIRFCAYEQLSALDSILIKRIYVGADFSIDIVSCPGDKVIYAYRKNMPRIVLFGDPIICNKDLFVDVNQVMINSRPGDKYVSLVRKHPARPKLIGPLNCGYNIADIIRTLGYAPEINQKKIPWPGLGISYSDILLILDSMCHNNMIPARYSEESLVNNGGFVEKQPGQGR